MCEEDMAAHL